MSNLGPGLASLLDQLARQQGAVLAVSVRQPEVRIAAMAGRILCIEIGGVRAPFAVAPEQRDEIRAAIAKVHAVRADRRDPDDAIPDSMRVVRQAISHGLADALRRVDELCIPADAWTIRPMDAPSEPSSIRGETIAQLRAMLEGAGAPRKERNLMNLRAVLQSIQKCVAVGIVDLESGGLLAIETPRPYPEDFLGLLGAKSKDLFTDDITKQIEDYFARSKGQPAGGPPRFDVWSAEIEPTKTTPRITHYFRRSGQRIYVFVAIGDINYTMFRSQTSMAASELDKQTITG